MKKSLLLFLLTLLICGTCNATIHPTSIGIAGLKPSYTIQQAQSIYEAQSIYGPGRFVPGERGIPTSYIFGDSLRCYFVGNIICWIVSDGKNGLTTPDGIKVGDTLNKVYSVYGKPDSTDIKKGVNDGRILYSLLQVDGYEDTFFMACFLHKKQKNSWH